jgi:polysaccharide pyruvyl transferase WcaK-like protein
MKILLIHHNANNLGDVAIAQSTIAQVNKIFPTAEIILESNNVELSKKQFPNITVIERLFEVYNIKHVKKTISLNFIINNSPFILKTIKAIIDSILFLLFHKNTKPILNSFKNSDIVLSIAGDSISEDYAYYLRYFEMWLLSKFKTPLILYAQSIGPFNGINTYFARKFLSLTTAIFARDKKTSDLMKKYKISSPIYLTADTVISLKSKKTERANTAIINNKLDQNIVGIVIRTKLYTKCSDQEYESYLKGMNNIIEYVNTLNLKTIFIPSIPEDEEASEIFNYKFGLQIPILKIFDYMPDEVKTILSNLKLVISPRMHPIILSSSMGVPVIGLGKEFKMIEYLESIESKEYFNRMIPLDEVLIKSQIDKILVDHKNISIKIKHEIFKVKQRSDANAIYLKEVYLNKK